MQSSWLSMVVSCVVMACGFLAACGSSSTGGSSNNAVNSTGGGGGGGMGGSDNASPFDLCMQMCETSTANNCPAPSDCTQNCNNVVAKYPSECDDEFIAAFGCVLPFASTCPQDTPADCVDESDALDMCQAANGCSSGSSCFGGSDQQGNQTCECSATCQMEELRANCTTPAGGGPATCDCLVNGASVGQCQNATEICDVLGGCCNTEYFKR